MALNSVNLVGRLTRDPELKITQSNKKVVGFNIAVNNRFKDKPAAFPSCVAFDRQAEFMSNYLSKGSLVSIEGRIQTRDYLDKENRKIYVTEIVVDNIDSLESISRNQETTDYQEEYNNEYKQVIDEDEPILDITSDDLPF